MAVRRTVRVCGGRAGDGRSSPSGSPCSSSLPTAIGALPARSSDLSATELLAKVKASGSVGHSGYAESVGGLDLPLTDDFTALTSLLGDRTRIRSWWRSDEDWRVDAVQTTGEAGTYRDPSGIWSWDYEQDTIVRTSEPTVRLPRVSDVEPAALARRLLSEARAADVSRHPEPAGRRPGRRRPAAAAVRQRHHDRPGRRLGRPGHRAGAAGRDLREGHPAAGAGDLVPRLLRADAAGVGDPVHPGRAGQDPRRDQPRPGRRDQRVRPGDPADDAGRAARPARGSSASARSARTGRGSRCWSRCRCPGGSPARCATSWPRRRGRPRPPRAYGSRSGRCRCC